MNKQKLLGTIELLAITVAGVAIMLLIGGFVAYVVSPRGTTKPISPEEYFCVDVFSNNNEDALNFEQTIRNCEKYKEPCFQSTDTPTKLGKTVSELTQMLPVAELATVRSKTQDIIKLCKEKGFLPTRLLIEAPGY